MANEATLLVQRSIPENFTVSNGTGIEKGALLTLSDPNTVATSSSDSVIPIVGGIAAVEKIASDGITELAVHRDGVFRVIASGSIGVGDPVAVLSGSTFPNYVHSVAAATLLSGSRILGESREAATNGQTFKMELRPSFTVG